MLTPPSPSTSPSFSTTDSTNSRKRQRSLSMDSESSSSSPKRSVSADPNHDGHDTPRPKDISTLTISDAKYRQELDAYMAEQGEDSLVNDHYDASQGQHTNETRALTPQPTPPPPSTTGDTQMSPSQKRSYIEQLHKAPMQIGQTWYVVSRRWYKRWQKACSGEEDKEGKVEEKDLGPVDNSNLVDVRGELVQQCIEGVDVEYIPEEAWNAFVKWYGEPRYPLKRTVVGRGISQVPTLELHPPRLRAYRVVAEQSDISSGTIPPQDVIISSTDTASDVRQALIRSLFPSESDQQWSYRVWKFVEPPTFRQEHLLAKDLQDERISILKDSSEKAEDALIDDGDVFAVEAAVDDQWIVPDTTSASSESSLIKTDVLPPTPQSTQEDVDTPKPLFGSSDFFSKLQGRSASPLSTVTTTTFSAKPPPPPRAGPSKDPRLASKASSIVPGTLGLGNMGNTCFMNSAIQCLAHTKELMDFFLTGVYEQELNPVNPLGMKGAIAEAFGALLRRIWTPIGSSTSYSPREFKQVLQKFAPQFGGYQQHDSQELVAFLLDGLHEDLNRVLQKPYVEKPDWEGGGDKELVALARQSWEGYMKRNDSVIVDLFQGQYQSTLVCPECKKVSITFDPFMYLTLPLPIKKKWKHTISYVPWDLEKPQLKIPVEINRDASFKDLRNLLGRWMDVNPDHLLTIEVFSNRFYKNLDDHTPVSDLGDSDDIMCFELPCHSQQSRSHKKQDDDPFIAPVFLTGTPNATRTGFTSSTYPIFGRPFVVAIDQKQATSEDAIYDLVADRLQRWTKHSRDIWSWEAGSVSTPMEEVPIPIAPRTPPDSLTEITETGEVVTVEEPVLEEGDIADAKGLVVQEDDEPMDLVDEAPRRVGFKKSLFRMHLQPSSAQYGVGYGAFQVNPRADTWAVRKAKGSDEDPPVLLRFGDAVLCEFDPNLKAYFFGEQAQSYELSTFNTWEEFIHPELKAAREAAGEKKSRGIALQDCLDEFTKEEQLGEDDLWYCPQCKKHQQATKRFDLWSVPDVLVVHLKRFSNSRMLRDKIDAFVDFPVEGLDLTSMVQERRVARRLVEAGEDVKALGLSDIDEPLVYDLFAVDEHLGALGGGHYRAYAYNEGDKKWHHFDDSYVSESTATAAVNSNAYLLFYRRRTSQPLGGKTYEKIETARRKADEETQIQPETENETTLESNEGLAQLPTPPSDPENPFDARPSVSWDDKGYRRWDVASSKSQSSASSPPPLDDAELPSFEEAQSDTVLQSTLGPLSINPQQLDYPDPSSNRDSPSSVQAEFDRDHINDLDDDIDVPPSAWDSQSGFGGPVTLSRPNMDMLARPYEIEDDEISDVL